MEFPRRKPMRLPNYDYRKSGYYFITICAYNRKNIFSEIVGQGLAPAALKLTECGKIAEEYFENIEKRYPTVTVDKYVIMPNHIHAIIVIENDSAGASPRPTLSDIVCAYKSLVAHTCRNISVERIFQSSYYDHIIRGENDYKEIWNYIENNPTKWLEDRYYNG